MKRSIGPRSRRFMRDLKNHVQAQDGRGVELATFLGIKPVVVYNWWGGKRFPTLEQALGAIEWLQKERDAI